jgi:hypothetical protein
MKQFFVKLFWFAFVFFVIDKLFYLFLFISPKLEVDTRLEKLITGQINKELIVLGSSRGARNIIASQIAKETNKSAYNLSYPGSNIEFHLFLLKTLLKFNEKPEIIILTLDDSAELLEDNSIKYRLDRLYPLAQYNYINQEMINRGDRNNLSWVFCLARLNKSNYTIFNKKFSDQDAVKFNGDMQLNFQRKNRDYEYNSNSVSYEIGKELNSKRMAFKHFQKVCSTNNIKLILCFPPNFRNHNKIFENRIRQISLNNNKLFIYDTTNVNYKNKTYFYDESHLNSKGAKIFTSELITFINNIK